MIVFAVKRRRSRFSAVPAKMGIIDESVETKCQELIQS